METIVIEGYVSVTSISASKNSLNHNALMIRPWVQGVHDLCRRVRDVGEGHRRYKSAGADRQLQPTVSNGRVRRLSGTPYGTKNQVLHLRGVGSIRLDESLPIALHAARNL